MGKIIDDLHDQYTPKFASLQEASKIIDRLSIEDRRALGVQLYEQNNREHII